MEIVLTHTAKHICNSHKPAPKPKSAKELALPNPERKTTKRQQLGRIIRRSRINPAPERLRD